MTSHSSGEIWFSSGQRVRSITETVDNNKAVTDTREAQRSVCTGWTDAQT